MGPWIRFTQAFKDPTACAIITLLLNGHRPCEIAEMIEGATAKRAYHYAVRMRLRRRTFTPEDQPDLPDGCKEIEGFPFYCVSPDGVVYSCRTRGGWIVAWRPLKQFLLVPITDSRSRFHVSLRCDGRSTPYFKSVHTLVLEAFVGRRPLGKEACHNDGNRFNNHVANLRWDTHKANMRDKELHGRASKGENNPEAVLTNEEVRNIRDLYKTGMFQYQIGKLFGVSQRTVSVICRRESWAHVP